MQLTKLLVHWPKYEKNILKANKDAESIKKLAYKHNNLQKNLMFVVLWNTWKSNSLDYNYLYTSTANLESSMVSENYG